MTQGPDTCRYAIGRLVVDIAGDDVVLDDVRDELDQGCRTADASPAARTSNPADLVFRFGPWAPAEQGITVAGMTITKDGIEASRNRLHYRVTGDDRPRDVQVESRLTSWRHRVAPDPLTRLRDRAYLTPTENAAKAFMYNLFDFTTQLAGLPAGQSWLHASAVTDGERSLALIAPGGAGKTSTMLHLMRDPRWKYLSDDLVVLDDNGALHRSPKRLQVYGYNTQDDELLYHRLLGDRDAVDRAAWRARAAVLGGHRVRRRVDAASIFGERAIGTTASLTHAVYLRRTATTTVQVQPTTPQWIANRAAMTLLDELRPLTQLSITAQSVTDDCLLPSPPEIASRSGAVILCALERSNARTWLIDVPRGAAPDALVGPVRDIVDG